MRKLSTLRFVAGCLPLWIVLLAVLSPIVGWSQTNPTARAVPFTENFGTGTFTTAPSGFASWSGLSGAGITSQALAEASVPSANGPISAATSAQTTGATYGFATSSNGRIYVQTSGNTSAGVNQIAMALNSTGLSSIVLGYDVEIISAQPRTVGVVCQYRVGTSGSWTTITAGSGSNPYSQAGGTTGVKTTVSATLPSACDNQAVVQIRWAVWRGTESGASSGVAIDNVSTSGTALGTNTSVAFTSASSTVSEGVGTTSLTVSISDFSSTTATTVDVAIFSGSATRVNSYTTQTLTFPANDGSNQSQTITVTNNTLCDGDAVITFRLQNISGGQGTPFIPLGTRDHVLTITDNDVCTGVSFDVTSATVSEGVGTYNVQVNITNFSPSVATTVDVVLTSGSAARINNYTTQTVTFPANSGTAQNCHHHGYRQRQLRRHGGVELRSAEHHRWAGDAVRRAEWHTDTKRYG
jgi:hypothetical protein